MRSFLRIDGDEFPLVGARIVWYPASSHDGDGIAFQLAAHGSRNLLHVAAWVPASGVEELSGAEVTVAEAGPDAALDGRLFRAALIRFGRVRERRAIVSVDGDIEGLEPGSNARAQVLADIDCALVAAAVPEFCNRCGKHLSEENEPYTHFVAGQMVTATWRRPTCRDCRSGQPGLVPPARCTTCGAAYGNGDVDWQADELVLAYSCVCPQGHRISGSATLAA